MQLYSKRNGDRDIRRYSLRIRPSDTEKKEGAFISDSLRNRLKEVIKFIIKSGDYLESFLFVNNQDKKQVYLHEETIKDLTLRELGYDMSRYIDLEDLENKTANYEDLKFFDLIEILIIFCREEKRDDFIERINTVFKEESDTYQVHGYMIINKHNEGLRSIIPLIKEKNLKTKLTQYYESSNFSPNFEVLSKISAEIIQLLFSSPAGHEKNKEYAIDLCRKIAERWTDEDKSEDLKNLLNETVKNAKSLFNKITNVRHTDRGTIPVGTPNIYKLINSKNIHLVELAILSLPEEYIMEQSPEELKGLYLQNYKINKGIGWVVEKKLPAEVNIDDIPF